ncbi:MAG: GntR family transcriptional regulator [Oscillospiraceae bacterium]|nr:GntR family transcriptional regulator [Oscillospiraceae bacterium]
MIHLDYRDSRPIYTQIVDNFRILIQKGILQEGDKLPSVRELAAELSINPNTIQRAYRELEVTGYIASVTGKGSFVCGKTRKSQEEQPLWEALDGAVSQLLTLGVSQYEIIQHLKQGGDIDASNE